MKKIFLLSLLTFILSSMTPSVSAADFNLACSSGSGCSPSLSTFFSSSEIWYPGKTITKSVQFTNTSATVQKIGTRAINTMTSGAVDQVIDLVIAKSDSTVLFSNSLYSFYGAGEIVLLADLSAGASETFSYSATMYTTSDNEYQDKRTQFDLVLGLISSPSSPPAPCDDAVPSTPGPITLSRVNDTEVKIILRMAGNPVTGYRISWSKDTDIDGEGEGTRSVGKTTETNITDLHLLTNTYYFKVRSVNGCKEGTTTGIAIIPTPIPTLVISSPILSPVLTTKILGISTSSGAQSNIKNSQPSQKAVKGIYDHFLLPDSFSFLKYFVLLGATIIMLVILYKIWISRCAKKVSRE